MSSIQPASFQRVDQKKKKKVDCPFLLLDLYGRDWTCDWVSMKSCNGGNRILQMPRSVSQPVSRAENTKTFTEKASSMGGVSQGVCLSCIWVRKNKIWRFQGRE